MAFAVTAVEALFALTLLRALYRAGRWLLRLAPADHPVEKAARPVGYEVPAGFEAHRGGRLQRRGAMVATGSVPAPTGAGVA